MAVSVSNLKLTTKASGAQLVLSVPNILGTCSMQATSMAYAEGAEEQGVICAVTPRSEVLAGVHAQVGRGICRCRPE